MAEISEQVDQSNEVEQKQQQLPKLSSYQTLMEGYCEVRIETKDGKQSICLTELLRDLYTKHYSAMKTIVEMQEKIMTLEAKLTPPTNELPQPPN